LKLEEWQLEEMFAVWNAKLVAQRKKPQSDFNGFKKEVRRVVAAVNAKSKGTEITVFMFTVRKCKERLKVCVDQCYWVVK